MITESGHILTPSSDYDIQAYAQWFWDKAVSYYRRRLELQVRASMGAGFTFR